MAQFKILAFLFFSSFYTCFAKADFHTVGWVNTFVPGGGRFMMGEYGKAAKEATLEVGTFAIGYSISPDGQITLDGTPVGYPAVTTFSYISTSIRKVCIKRNPITEICEQREPRLVSRSQKAIDYSPADATHPLTAAVLQEFGLKYHIMNVFFSYRDQFNIEGAKDPGQGIDQRSASAMLKDPFQKETLTSPWVYIPILFASTFAYFDYKSQNKLSASNPISPLNTRSKVFTAFDQMIMYPVGSAAPEETFYRGFLQNELYYAYRTPYFAIPMSSLLFALSHSQDSWPSAFITGLYQGFLAYNNNGNLAFGNAVHFWGVVALGLESYILTLNSQAHAPAAVNFSFTF